MSTLRAWVKSWKWDDSVNKALNPPTKPTDEELELVNDDDLVDEYKSLRRLALDRLREVIPKTNSADQLGRIVGNLSDRIDRSEGIHGDPSTVNVNIRLDAARDAGEKMLTGVQKMIADANQRHDHIIDVESQEIASESEEVPNE